MYYFIYLLTFSVFFFSHFSMAKNQGHDPFYPQQNVSQIQIPTVSQLKNNHVCKQEGKKLAANFNFKQLKIVGVVKAKDKNIVLFINDNNELLVARKGMLVAKEGFKVEDIQLNKVSFKKLLFTSGCKKSEVITIQI